MTGQAVNALKRVFMAKATPSKASKPAAKTAAKTAAPKSKGPEKLAAKPAPKALTKTAPAAKKPEVKAKKEEPVKTSKEAIASKVASKATENPKKTVPPSTPSRAAASVAPAKARESDGEERELESGASSEEESPVRSTVRPSMHSSDLFNEAELANFRKLLADERRKLLVKAQQAMASGNITLEKDEMYDEVDLASATVEQNLTFRLLDRDRKLLAEIDHAIAKMDTGDYGFCEGTGEPIPKRRLELRPWCRHSVKFKEQLERMKKSGRGVVDEDEV